MSRWVEPKSTFMGTRVFATQIDGPAIGSCLVQRIWALQYGLFSMDSSVWHTVEVGVDTLSVIKYIHKHNQLSGWGKPRVK